MNDTLKRNIKLIERCIEDNKKKDICGAAIEVNTIEDADELLNFIADNWDYSGAEFSRIWEKDMGFKNLVTVWLN